MDHITLQKHTREGSIIYGRPWPDYSESTGRYVKLFIPREKPNLAFTKMISNEENRTGRSLPIYSLLILSAIQRERRLDVHRMTEVINISDNRAKSNVERLIKSGLIEAVGNGKSRVYILSAKVYRDNDNAVGYVRQTGKDSIKYEELVLKFRILKKLAAAGKLKLEGNGRSSRYKLIKK